MGDQVRARKEYEIGFQEFSIPQQHWILWKTREADTYVRDGITPGRMRLSVHCRYANSAHMDQIERYLSANGGECIEPEPEAGVDLLDQSRRRGERGQECPEVRDPGRIRAAFALTRPNWQ